MMILKQFSSYLQFQRQLITSVKSDLGRILMVLKWLGMFLVALLLVETGYIMGLMPDWEEFKYGPIPKSRYIKKYEYEHSINNSLPKLRWYPVSISQIPKQLIRTVIVAEDSRFYQHQGFDQEALKKAMEYNLSKGKLIYGASTISQQTVKNLFLTPSRNPLRKFHEAILTYAMEKNVGKQRIIEIYLNNAEFGRGIYGVEAAARYYYAKSAIQLSDMDSIKLAATLPSPIKHNPNTQTEQFIKRQNKIKQHLAY